MKFEVELDTSDSLMTADEIEEWLWRTLRNATRPNRGDAGILYVDSVRPARRDLS